MHFETIFSAAVLAAVPAAAFTNGTLVPAYICNPVNDGMPKSFGQLLQLTREKTPVVAFSQNAGQNVQAPQLQQQGNSQIGNSAYILASLHDSPNNINTQQQSLVVKPQGGNTIVAGQANKITLSTKDNSQLKGALLYGQDGTGTRQGSFTDANNGPFVPFPGCGKNPQGDISGVIQQTGVTAASSYSSLVYNAPACVPGGNITIGGLSVTGNGFGIWTYSFAVTGSTCGGGNGATGGSTGGSTGGQGTGAGTGGNSGNTGKGSGGGKATTSSAGTRTGAGAAQGSSIPTASTASAAANAATSAAAQASASTNATSAAAQAQSSAGGKKGYGQGKQGWKYATTFTKVAAKAKSTCTK